MHHVPPLTDEASEAALRPLDPLLLMFVTARTEVGARDELARLLSQVMPAIQKITARSPYPEDDAQEALQQLIQALWQCKANPSQAAIGNLKHYAAVVAAHVTRRRWRAERPVHHALREALRHTLRTDGRFALWERDGLGWLCGTAAWRGHAPGHSERLAQLQQHPQALADMLMPQQDVTRAPQAALLAAIFQWLEHPIGFEALATVIAELRHIEELLWQSTDDAAEDERPLRDTLAAQAPGQDEESAWRQFLTALWSEVEQLPPLQRIAYLLNFTAADGALEIFWLYGVASVRRIGAVLQLTDEHFACAWAGLDDAARVAALQASNYDERFALLWRYLPLNDLTIARLLGTERQKVINLRKAAGDRLARRLAVFQGLGGDGD
jgi:hypothetical protein